MLQCRALPVETRLIAYPVPSRFRNDNVIIPVNKKCKTIISILVAMLERMLIILITLNHNFGRSPEELACVAGGASTRSIYNAGFVIENVGKGVLWRYIFPSCKFQIGKHSS